jgi:hypothetical protein
MSDAGKCYHALEKCEGVKKDDKEKEDEVKN